MLMSKNLKLSYILFFIFSAIIIAWKTLSSFFSGVAINFVAIIGLTITILLLSTKDKCLMRKVGDLFVLSCVFCVLELFIYFAFEMGWNNIDSIEGFLTYQNIISLFGFLFFAHTTLRFALELNNKKLKFIEILLGNENRIAKAKTSKELSNGCLEDKPNKKSSDCHEDFQNSDTEEVVVIEDEE